MLQFGGNAGRAAELEREAAALGSRIREKIEPNTEDPHYLRTVGGTGYRFESPK